MNERGCWTEKEEIDTYCIDEQLSDAIINLFEVNTVVDIGCGNGAYVRNFLKHGINCIGYDGSPLVEQTTNGLCKIMDFSMPVDIGKFDLVHSIEVGEHIPEKYEQIFIDNICNASYQYVVLSWAIPGQGGTGHVNCKENYYIIGEMQKRGFKINTEGTKFLRVSGCLSWIKNTVMVFEK